VSVILRLTGDSIAIAAWCSSSRELRQTVKRALSQSICVSTQCQARSQGGQGGRAPR